MIIILLDTKIVPISGQGLKGKKGMKLFKLPSSSMEKFLRWWVRKWITAYTHVYTVLPCVWVCAFKEYICICLHIQRISLKESYETQQWLPLGKNLEAGGLEKEIFFKLLKLYTFKVFMMYMYYLLINNHDGLLGQEKNKSRTPLHAKRKEPPVNIIWICLFVQM